MYQQIACIGYGNMGEAFLKAIAAHFPSTRLLVLEKDTAKAAKAETECKARIVGTLDDLISGSDALILAIKPQDAGALLSILRQKSFNGHILSILGGKTSTWIGETAGNNLVARFMPSLAASVGKGAIALCLNPGQDCSTSDREKLASHARMIAAAVGTVYEIPEHLMGAFTGVSGSGIAYAWSFIHGMAMGGVQNGLPYANALAMTCDMVEGAAVYLKTTGEHPVAMLSKVCSPGGTTIEGMHALDSAGFQGTCMDAVRAAARRSKELEG